MNDHRQIVFRGRFMSVSEVKEILEHAEAALDRAEGTGMSPATIEKVEATYLEAQEALEDAEIV